MERVKEATRVSTKPPLVLIHWLDAAGAREREDLEPIHCLTVGWIIEQSAKNGHQYVKVTSELQEGNESSEHVVIPEGMIQSITVIRKRLPKPFGKWRIK